MPTLHNKLLSNRLEKSTQEEKNIKAMQWQRVKEKTPEIANLMLDINKVFGKPKNVTVERKGEEILKSGDFYERPLAWNGKLRTYIE